MPELPESDEALDEERTPLHDSGIKLLIPKQYQVEYVTRCRSTLYFGDSSSEDDRWVRDYGKPMYCQNRYAIEITNTRGRVVAAVGWYVSRESRKVYTIATYVDRRLRRRGLGQALWQAMLRIVLANGYTSVHGCAATDAGYALLRSMKRKFPRAVSFDDDRLLYL
jgi:GNAT superfamily N-acetyltransferase